MADLFAKLGVDWRLLIAQIFNFAILFFVLRRFAYKPLLKALNDRRDKVAKSIDDAQALERRVAKSEEERQEKLLAAEQEANIIIAETRREAEHLKVRMLDAATSEIESMKREASSEAKQMKERALMEARVEIAGLVVSATEKVLREKLTSTRDHELIQKTLKELGQ